MCARELTLQFSKLFRQGRGTIHGTLNSSVMARLTDTALNARPTHPPSNKNTI